MRKETGDDRYYAPMERNTKTLAQKIEHVLARPFKILFQEPMLMASTLYLSVSSRFFCRESISHASSLSTDVFTFSLKPIPSSSLWATVSTQAFQA